ncbi:hypothetical protein AB0I51_33595 [Streptomyces sp. NPDC050549]|uniref:hypothetical protein n=1 Tax=Streptomyces sp. NPDC050549 TaxID=3155406 RepID=UPI0034318349
MYAAIGAFLVRRARLVLAVSGVAPVGAVLLSGGAFTKLQGGGFTPAGPSRSPPGSWSTGSSAATPIWSWSSRPGPARSTHRRPAKRERTSPPR